MPCVCFQVFILNDIDRGGRGFGGRAANRQTVQPKDIFVEGITMAYLNKNLLDRTTLRLQHGRSYGLIGKNGVGMLD